ncbi:hypothetical protein EPIB1_400 [Tritonibacter mobilis]|nr:hypothetical protein EPIB1_400 [Tritonibacter mobilis]
MAGAPSGPLDNKKPPLVPGRFGAVFWCFCQFNSETRRPSVRHVARIKVIPELSELLGHAPDASEDSRPCRSPKIAMISLRAPGGTRTGKGLYLRAVRLNRTGGCSAKTRMTEIPACNRPSFSRAICCAISR